MKRIFASIVFLLLNGSQWVAAEDLGITALHPLVRPGQVHRFAVDVVTAQSQGKLQVVVSADNFRQEFPFALKDIAQQRRVFVNWLAPANIVADAIRIDVLWQSGIQQQSAWLECETVNAVANRIADLSAPLIKSEKGDPLLSLWLEQAALQLRDAQDLAGLQLLLDHEQNFRKWAAGWRPPLQPAAWNMRAFRDPIDGSIQPWRVHIPTGALQSLAVVLADPQQDVLRKDRWPLLDQSLVTALNAAGCAVIEVYPGGDRTWQAGSLVQVKRVLAQARQLLAAPSVPVLLCGIGRGGGGVLRLAQAAPDAVDALLVVDGRFIATKQEAQASQPNAAEWRDQRLRVTSRLAQLRGLPITLVRPAAALLQDLAPTDPHVLKQLGTDDVRSLLSRGSDYRGVREYQVLAPGRFGPFLVEGLLDWRKPGVLQWDAERKVVRAPGLSSVRWVEGAAPPDLELDGLPYLEPQPAPAGGKGFGAAQGPLVRMLSEPVQVVLGTSEHQAARDRNQQLLLRLRQAWAQHRHGFLRHRSDVEVDAILAQDRSLILIGNTRSNAVLARLKAEGLQLPVQWDHRSVQINGAGYLRAGGAAIALVWPHPRWPNKHLYILDGDALALDRGAPPFAGVGDFVWRIGSESQAQFLVFDSDWRP